MLAICPSGVLSVNTRVSVCTIIVTQVTVVFAGLIVETSIPCHPSLSLIWKYHCIRTCLNTRLQNYIVNAHTNVHVYKSAIIYVMYGSECTYCCGTNLYVCVCVVYAPIFNIHVYRGTVNYVLPIHALQLYYAVLQ